jgi:transposase
LYCALVEERRGWQQRIHAQLFHQGCPPVKALLSEAGRKALVAAELSAAGRQCVDTASRRIAGLTAEIDPLRTQLASTRATARKLLDLGVDELTERIQSVRHSANT